MTKKHFKLLAAALLRTKPMYFGDPDHADATLHVVAYHQWTHDVVAIMQACEESNPNFKKNKFMEACGIPNLVLT